MTTIDTTPAAPTTSERRKALVDRIVDGTPYAVAFGGQGVPWLEPLAELVRDFALEAELESLVDAGRGARRPRRRRPPAVGHPVHAARVGRCRSPSGSPAEDDDAPELPAAELLAAPAASLPGILLTQLAGVRALEAPGPRPS